MPLEDRNPTRAWGNQNDQKTLQLLRGEIRTAIREHGHIRLLLLPPSVLSLSSRLSSLPAFSMASVSITPRISTSVSHFKVVDFNRRKLMLLRGSCKQTELDVSCSKDGGKSAGCSFNRRKLVMVSSVGLIGNAFSSILDKEGASASEFADMPALRGKDYGKSKMRYPDYTKTQSGLQYKDLRTGEGPLPKMGDTVVVDWDGYTIGYYGRIFEARNKTKGGSFEGDDKDFFKFKLGSQQVIQAFEEAVVGMAPGGIRSNAG